MNGKIMLDCKFCINSTKSMQGLKILKHPVLVFPKIAKPYAPVICIHSPTPADLREWAGNRQANVQAYRALTFLEVCKV